MSGSSGRARGRCWPAPRPPGRSTRRGAAGGPQQAPARVCRESRGRGERGRGQPGPPPRAGRRWAAAAPQRGAGRWGQAATALVAAARPRRRPPRRCAMVRPGRGAPLARLSRRFRPQGCSRRRRSSPPLRSGPLGRFLSALKSVRSRPRAGERRCRIGPGPARPYRGRRWWGAGGRTRPARRPHRGGSEAAVCAARGRSWGPPVGPAREGGAERAGRGGAERAAALRRGENGGRAAARRGAGREGAAGPGRRGAL